MPNKTCFVSRSKPNAQEFSPTIEGRYLPLREHQLSASVRRRTHGERSGRCRDATAAGLHIDDARTPLTVPVRAARPAGNGGGVGAGRAGGDGAFRQPKSAADVGSVRCRSLRVTTVTMK